MKNIIVIKIGGQAGNFLSPAFFQQIQQWQKNNKFIIVIHGGGASIDQMLNTFQLPIKKQNGLRITDHETLEITKMTLLGQVQPQIIQQFEKHQLAPIGLNPEINHCLQGDFLNFQKLGYVGKLLHVNASFFIKCCQLGLIPIIAPLIQTSKKEWLNINGDHLASTIACAVKAESLYLLTDVPGIKQNKRWITHIKACDLKSLSEKSFITGGMIPKVTGALTAIDNGVKSVWITNTIQQSGTKITL